MVGNFLYGVGKAIDPSQSTAARNDQRRLRLEKEAEERTRGIAKQASETELLNRIIPVKTASTIQIGEGKGEQDRKTIVTAGQASESYDATQRKGATTAFQAVFPMVNDGVLAQQSNLLTNGLQYAINAEERERERSYQRMMEMQERMRPKLGTVLAANAPALLGTVLGMFGA
jgi:biopolymer transport protein ExbB/TolQ